MFTVLGALYHHQVTVDGLVGGMASGCYVAYGAAGAAGVTAFFPTGSIFGAPAGAVALAAATITTFVCS